MKNSFTHSSTLSTRSSPLSTQRPALIAQDFIMPLPLSEELRHCTGKGVKVAVIDSGIDANSPAFRNVFRGIGIDYYNDQIKLSRKFIDENGHGTRICNIICSNAPNVDLYIIKIFGKKLIAEMNCLVRGIEWAIKKQVHIINISLGTNSSRSIGNLKRICGEANKKNILIVSTLNNRNGISYPGWLSSVYCAYNKNLRNPSNKKNKLIGFSFEMHEIIHNSFVAPILTSYLALIMENIKKKEKPSLRRNAKSINILDFCPLPSNK